MKHGFPPSWITGLSAEIGIDRAQRRFQRRDLFRRQRAEHLLLRCLDRGVHILRDRGSALRLADDLAAFVRRVEPAAHEAILLHAVDDGDSLFIAAAGHEREEFIAAEAEDVVLAGDIREDVGNRLDQEVAARMAEGVVHLLEPVDVDEDDGVHRAGSQALVDKIIEGASVADACELVDRADRVQLLDVIAIAHHDGADAQDGMQRLGDSSEALFGRIDDGDVAE